MKFTIKLQYSRKLDHYRCRTYRWHWTWRPWTWGRPGGRCSRPCRRRRSWGETARPSRTASPCSHQGTLWNREISSVSSLLSVLTWFACSWIIPQNFNTFTAILILTRVKIVSEKSILNLTKNRRRDFSKVFYSGLRWHLSMKLLSL